MKSYLCAIKKKKVICLHVDDEFITNSPLQLLYHGEVLNPTKGNYELIIFHNISQLDDQKMLELAPVEHDTKPITQCFNMGKNGLCLCMTLMMLCMCTHKNIKFKYHMNMFTNLNIFVGNPSMTMS
jgi:hypothetical protein